MAKNKRQETEAQKFLGNASSEGQENQDVSESESAANQADQKKPEASPKEKAVKSEPKGSEVPGKYRKFQ